MVYSLKMASPVWYLIPCYIYNNPTCLLTPDEQKADESPR